MCGVSVFFVLFTLAFTTGWTSREHAFYWVFYFPNLSLFVSSYIKMKKFCLFYFNRLAISWPPWVRVWGWASYRLLPFTGFSLGLPFCFSSYIIHLQCTSEGQTCLVYAIGVENYTFEAQTTHLRLHYTNYANDFFDAILFFDTVAVFKRYVGLLMIRAHQVLQYRRWFWCKHRFWTQPKLGSIGRKCPSRSGCMKLLQKKLSVSLQRLCYCN